MRAPLQATCAPPYKPRPLAHAGATGDQHFRLWLARAGGEPVWRKHGAVGSAVRGDTASGCGMLRGGLLAAKRKVVQQSDTPTLPHLPLSTMLRPESAGFRGQHTVIRRIKHARVWRRRLWRGEHASVRRLQHPWIWRYQRAGLWRIELSFWDLIAGVRHASELAGVWRLWGLQHACVRCSSEQPGVWRGWSFRRRLWGAAGSLGLVLLRWACVQGLSAILLWPAPV